MRRLTAVTLGLLAILPAFAAEVFPREYGVATTVGFSLPDYDNPVDLATNADVTFATGDVKFSCNGGAQANIDADAGAGVEALPTEVAGSQFSQALTAVQMQCAQIHVFFIDTATKVWADWDLIIETYGHASAMHPDGYSPLMQAAVEDIPTNAELATALGTADDAVLTAVGDVPTNAELATALGTADDAVIALIGVGGAGLTNVGLDAAAVRAAVGLATANLDIQLTNIDNFIDTEVADIPTNAELATALGTADDATLAAIAALDFSGLQMHAAIDATFLNCTVNTANFAGGTTTVACILTDRNAMAVTAASGDLTGLQFRVTSGAQIYEARFINATTWDATNSELRLTLSRGLPATLADAVTAVIW